MLQNAYFLAKIGADTAENEQHFAEILPTDGADGRPLLAQAAADLHRYNPPIWQKLAQINALPLAAVVRQLIICLL